MRVGDLVKQYSSIPRLAHSPDDEIGIIIDVFEDENGLWYFEVEWQYDRGWHIQDELKIVCPA